MPKHSAVSLRRPWRWSFGRNSMVGLPVAPVRLGLAAWVILFGVAIPALASGLQAGSGGDGSQVKNRKIVPYCHSDTSVGKALDKIDEIILGPPKPGKDQRVRRLYAKIGEQVHPFISVPAVKAPSVNMSTGNYTTLTSPLFYRVENATSMLDRPGNDGIGFTGSDLAPDNVVRILDITVNKARDGKTATWFGVERIGGDSDRRGYVSYKDVKPVEVLAIDCGKSLREASDITMEPGDYRSSLQEVEVKETNHLRVLFWKGLEITGTLRLQGVLRESAPPSPIIIRPPEPKPPPPPANIVDASGDDTRAASSRRATPSASGQTGAVPQQGAGGEPQTNPLAKETVVRLRLAAELLDPLSGRLSVDGCEPLGPDGSVGANVLSFRCKAGTPNPVVRVSAPYELGPVTATVGEITELTAANVYRAIILQPDNEEVRAELEQNYGLQTISQNTREMKIKRPFSESGLIINPMYKDMKTMGCEISLPDGSSLIVKDNDLKCGTVIGHRIEGVRLTAPGSGPCLPISESSLVCRRDAPPRELRWGTVWSAQLPAGPLRLRTSVATETMRPLWPFAAPPVPQPSLGTEECGKETATPVDIRYCDSQGECSAPYALTAAQPLSLPTLAQVGYRLQRLPSHAQITLRPIETNRTVAVTGRWPLSGRLSQNGTVADWKSLEITGWGLMTYPVRFDILPGSTLTPTSAASLVFYRSEAECRSSGGQLDRVMFTRSQAENRQVDACAWAKVRLGDKDQSFCSRAEMKGGYAEFKLRGSVSDQRRIIVLIENGSGLQRRSRDIVDSLQTVLKEVNHDKQVVPLSIDAVFNDGSRTLITGEEAVELSIDQGRESIAGRLSALDFNRTLTNALAILRDVDREYRQSVRSLVFVTSSQMPSRIESEDLAAPLFWRYNNIPVKVVSVDGACPAWERLQIDCESLAEGNARTTLARIIKDQFATPTPTPRAR